MFTIYPNGGLCNRLFALHSAIRLSADIGQPLRAVWITRSDFGCKFEDLFEVPPEVDEWRTFSHLRTGRGAQIKEAFDRYLRWPPLQPTMFPTEIKRLSEADFDFRSLGNKRHSDISSFGLFYRGNAGFYSFQPRAHLRSQIDAVTSQFGPNTVGLHLRRTDHVEAIERSPTERFEAEAQRVVDADPSATFFVASDDMGEVDRLAVRFPGKVLTNRPPSFDRSSLSGMEGAVVDLFCLSRTKRILGSSGSTFSEAAGLLGNIPVSYMVADRA